MKRRYVTTVSISALLCLPLLSTSAVSQTNKSATNPSPRKSASGAAKAIPAIKCTDRDSAVSCKSFKQLVDARDPGILFGIMGSPEDAGRHVAYVCPRRGVDTFTEVGFAVPEKKVFKPFDSTNDEKIRRLVAGMWLGDDPANPLSPSAINQWYKGHQDGLIFAQGIVGFTSYQDGQLAELKLENGEWSQPARATGSPHDDGYAVFGGYHYWIQEYNEMHEKESPEADEPGNMHLHIDGLSIYAHYDYKNRAGDTIDYVLQIHRSTGRFTETFKLSSDRDDVAGTCMIFKN